MRSDRQNNHVTRDARSTRVGALLHGSSLREAAGPPKRAHTPTNTRLRRLAHQNAPGLGVTSIRAPVVTNII